MWAVWESHHGLRRPAAPAAPWGWWVQSACVLTAPTCAPLTQAPWGSRPRLQPLPTSGSACALATWDPPSILPCPPPRQPPAGTRHRRRPFSGVLLTCRPGQASCVHSAGTRHLTPAPAQNQSAQPLVPCCVQAPGHVPSPVWTVFLVSGASTAQQAPTWARVSLTPCRSPGLPAERGHRPGWLGEAPRGGRVCACCSGHLP